MSNSLKEYRCKFCKKLFFKGDLKHCIIEVKCKKCKEVNKFEGVNCELFLLYDKDDSQMPYNKSSLFQNGVIKCISDKCSNCNKASSCKYSKIVAETKVCPFCHNYKT